jgi:hypothetical protein
MGPGRQSGRVTLEDASDSDGAEPAAAFGALLTTPGDVGVLLDAWRRDEWAVGTISPG